MTTPTPPDAAPAMVATIDVSTLTLGELSLLERESGSDFHTLIKAGRASRALVALWLTSLRRSTISEPRQTWHDLSSRPALGALSSTSPSASDGDPQTSKP